MSRLAVTLLDRRPFLVNPLANPFIDVGCVFAACIFATINTQVVFLSRASSLRLLLIVLVLQADSQPDGSGALLSSL